MGNNRRRTRIVITLGPATDAPGCLAQLHAAGADVARINFSHGTAEDHRRRSQQWREVAAQTGDYLGLLADLPGPKLRVLLPRPLQLSPGDQVTFSWHSPPLDPDDWAITEPDVLAAVQPGQRILLDDGRLQLEAVERTSRGLRARVVVGGPLSTNKGLNLPDTPLHIPALTERDRAALAVAAAIGVDWVALSFVRQAEAAAELRAACACVGLHVPVLAKIERPEAVAQAEAILDAFDGIMIARGDLGVEIPLEQVPMVQKRLIAAARARGKPVITATDMLDSMRHNPRPTRAEASDVANAICDGSDAVMLSGETAVGAYPVEAVACMARIIAETERHRTSPGEATTEQRRTAQAAASPAAATASGLEDALTLAGCRLADEVGAAAIVIPSVTGRTARLVARHRPAARIIATSAHVATLQQLTLVWGITPVLMRNQAGGMDRIAAAVRDAFHAQAIAAGDRVVAIAGHPIDGGPRHPTVRLVRVGSAGESLEP